MNLSATRTRAVVIVHLAATWFMVGLIWTIHFVHYPLFAKVGTDSFVAYENDHVDRIGKLLFVPWVTEGVTLLVLLWAAFIGRRRELRVPVLIGGVAMAVVLVVSGFWSAPAHGELMRGFDAGVHGRLMNADLVRTVAWTVRGITAAWILSLVWAGDRQATDETTPTDRQV